MNIVIEDVFFDFYSCLEMYFEIYISEILAESSILINIECSFIDLED